MAASEVKDFYNQIEPFIWYFVAVLIVPALRKYSPLMERIALAMAIAAFGTSDFYESIAWWTPWWLLMWKATCLLIIAIMSVRIWKHSKTRNVDGHRS